MPWFKVQHYISLPLINAMRHIFFNTIDYLHYKLISDRFKLLSDRRDLGHGEGNGRQELNRGLAARSREEIFATIHDDINTLAMEMKSQLGDF